jgi:heme oxygenase
LRAPLCSGRILARHFGGHLGVTPDAGCRFFSEYGERTGEMWSAFAKLMAGRPSAEDEEMLESSVATFELLGEWLESEAHD